MAEQHRPFRLPGEPQEQFDARMAEHAHIVASDPLRKKEPQWQNPHEPRKPAAAPKVARDHVAEARASLMAVDVKSDPIVAAVIVAQALDRLNDRIIEAAAIANYKRGG